MDGARVQHGGRLGRACPAVVCSLPFFLLLLPPPADASPRGIGLPTGAGPIVLAASDPGGPRREGDDPPLSSLWVDQPIEQIEVLGLTRTRPIVVLRELTVRPGDRVDWSRIEWDRQRLLDLGIFAEVRIDARRDTLADRPNLVISLRERPTFLAYPVLEYKPRNGVSYGAHAAHTNLFGLNRSLTFEFLLGAKRSVSLSLANPWIGGKRVAGGISARKARDRNDGQRETHDRTEFSAFVAPSMGPYVGFPASIGVEAIRTRTDATVPDPALVRYDDHRWIQVGAWRDTRAYRERPSSGYLVSGSASQHGGILGGTVAFQRYELELLQVVPTGREKALTLGGRLLWSRGPVPGYLQPTLGGAETLRGYGEGEFHGTSRWNAWAEQRFPLLPRRTFSVLRGRYTIDLTLDWAAFVDMGSIWQNAALEHGKARALWGGGIGLRLVAPLFRMVSFDVATDGKTLRLYTWGGPRL